MKLVTKTKRYGLAIVFGGLLIALSVGGTNRANERVRAESVPRPVANSNVSAAPRTPTYEISWSTIDGGGAQQLQGGAYALSGTIGQFDVGAAGNDPYAVSGGFWVDFFDRRLFIPILVR